MLPERQNSEAGNGHAAIFCAPGSVKEGDGVRFTASVPAGQEASLLLYDKKSGELVQEVAFPDEAQMGTLRTIKMDGLPWRRLAYNYKIDGQVVCDPYAAVYLKEEDAAEGGRCGMAFDEYDWQGDKRPDIPYEDAVMYHLHVRNFTRHAKSKVRHKGTFLGLAEKAGYLKELGINQVKLMPIYEPARREEEKPKDAAHMPPLSQPKENYWGYGAGYYFAPRRFYAATDDPVREVKDMVRTLHENGIEVILEMYFMPDTPLRMMLDCLTWWATEYHVDGFHIMGREEIGAWLAGDPYLAACKIIVSGVPECADGAGGGRRFAECNDGFLVDARRILKGDEGMLEAFAWRTRKNPAGHAVINYITNHDGFTLNDLVSYDNKHNEENGEQNQDGASYNFSWNCSIEGPTRKKNVLNLRRRQMRNAFLLMLLSQGTPMLLAGDEFGNSQGGNNNPYCLDNATSWVDWGTSVRGAQMQEFVKKAIAFRKSHRILHMAQEPQQTDYRSCGYPDLSYHSSRAWYGGFEYNSRQLGMLYCGKYVGQDELLYIAYNFHPCSQELALPKLPADMAWNIVIDTSSEEGFLAEETETKWDKTGTFPARTVMVLIARKRKQ